LITVFANLTQHACCSVCLSFSLNLAGFNKIAYNVGNYYLLFCVAQPANHLNYAPRIVDQSKRAQITETHKSFAFRNITSSVLLRPVPVGVRARAFSYTKLRHGFVCGESFASEKTNIRSSLY
jgi:hypothetical protein